MRLVIWVFEGTEVVIRCLLAPSKFSSPINCLKHKVIVWQHGLGNKRTLCSSPHRTAISIKFIFYVLFTLATFVRPDDIDFYVGDASVVILCIAADNNINDRNTLRDIDVKTTREAKPGVPIILVLTKTDIRDARVASPEGVVPVRNKAEVSAIISFHLPRSLIGWPDDVIAFCKSAPGLLNLVTNIPSIFCPVLGTTNCRFYRCIRLHWEFCEGYYWCKGGLWDCGSCWTRIQEVKEMICHLPY